MSDPIAKSISQFLTTPPLINDKGVRATLDMSLWIPDPKALVINDHHYYFLGLFGTNNYNCPPSPTGPYFCYRMNDRSDNEILTAPTGFSTIWECRDNGHPSNLGIYSPIAPSGYLGIGCVAVMDFNIPPNLDTFPNLMCVRQDKCVKVTLTESDLIWTDQGSGTPKNVSVWRLPNSGAAYAYLSQHNAPYPTSVEADDIMPTNS